jgi:DNA-binding transcriptional LysR family regulator
MKHSCISIRQGDEAYGVWRLTNTKGGNNAQEVVHVQGTLSTNDGEIAVKWALDGHGILLRAEWDLKQHLERGELIPLLSGYETPNADIYAVYAQRHQMSTRIRTFVDFFAHELAAKA